MARIALYRKYRPNDFVEIEGQEHIKKTLQNAIKSSSFSHAYIFCGPRGIGKTSIARIMAKAVNCKEADSRLRGNDRWDGNPCNKCDSCISINNQTALDIIEIDAASNRGIDEIRDLREKVKFSPSELKYKVFIIDEVHMLTKEAFNALLKTLEEPPSHALFIMATTEIHKIPATVISRCQRFDFKRISKSELEKRIGEIAKSEKIKIAKEGITLIANASEGGMRDAISILDQISMNFNGKEITETQVADLLGMIDETKITKLTDMVEKGQKKESLEFMEEMLADGADIGQLTKGIMDLYRGKVKESLGDDEQTGKFVHAIETLSECNRNFRFALYPQLSLEVAILKIINCFQGNSDDYTSSSSSAPVETKESSSIPKVTKKSINIDELEKKDSKKEAKGDDKSLEKWNQVLFEIKSKNNSIHAMMRESEPKLVGDEIHLVFPYKFHKERIEDRRNKQIVEGAISKVCGHSYSIICKLGQRRNMKAVEDESSEPAKKKQKKETTIDEFLDVLGGEVVS